MVLPNLYSRRKRQANKTGDDVYQYASISEKLRNQIIFMITSWSKRYRAYNTSEHPVFDDAVPLIREELGRQSLHPSGYMNSAVEFISWFREHKNLDDLLDAIEICVQYAAYWFDKSVANRKGDLDEDVAVLNARMLEDGFGFQIEGGQIVQLSSTFVHKEVTVPALALLAGSEYATANDEFRQAYQEFNQGNYDDCIHDCCNAFESVLKVILTKKGWTFGPNDTAKKLIDAAFANGLIPSYMQEEFTGLRTILQSGVPTVRNKEAGHGTGVEQRNIPKHIASFQLHQTAAAIILLVEAAK